MMKIKSANCNESVLVFSQGFQVFLLFISIVLPLTHSATCNIESFPIKSVNNRLVKPKFNFVTDLFCPDSVSISRTVTFNINTKDCRLFAQIRFVCDSRTGQLHLSQMECKNEWTGNTELKRIDVSGSAILFDNSSCQFNGSTTIEWIGDSNPDPVNNELGWPAIVGIIVGAIVFGVITFFLIRKYYWKNKTKNPLLDDRSMKIVDEES